MDLSNELKLIKSPSVYSPNDDTFFLTDIMDFQFYQELEYNPSFRLACEVGVGTGYISIVLGKKFPQVQIIGVDLSPQSALICHKNMSKKLKPNQFRVFCMDLLHGFNPSKFFPSIIFFNPPYVRTPEEEIQRGFLEKTWAGGPNGISIIWNFLEALANFSFHKAFFLSSAHNKNELVECHFSVIFDLKIIAERKVEDDRLLCYEVGLKGDLNE
ncbi:MAG: methyltransferase [Candidatus Hodarchaeales archaeon]